jgi:hypothetical protein
MTEWMHQLSFVVTKELELGIVEKKVKELGGGVKLLSYAMQELAEKKEPAFIKKPQ